MKFQIYRTKNKEWCFRIRASNGRILCHSETYKRKSGAMKAIQSISWGAEAAQVEVES